MFPNEFDDIDIKEITRLMELLVAQVSQNFTAFPYIFSG